jgi:uncharacterized damage-inducible protein DinB
LSLNLLSKTQAELNECLLQTNISALEEGVSLLALLLPSQYIQGFKPAFHSTIGAHFRHVLEHYRCFIIQLEGGEICYDKRERDQQLECDFDYANQAIGLLIDDLNALIESDLNRSCVLFDQQATQPVSTTIHRELLFLQSHTMHHYAIIGAMTRSFGAQPAKDFGVAIATRVHQECNDDDSAGRLSSVGKN